MLLRRSWRSVWCTSKRILLHVLVIGLLHHILLLYHRVILLLKVVSGKVVLEILKDVVMGVVFAIRSWVKLLLASELILVHHHFLGTLVLQLIRECLGVEQLEPLYPFETCEVFTFLDHLVSSQNLNIRIIFHLLLFILVDLGTIPLYEWWFVRSLGPRPSPATSNQRLLEWWTYSTRLLVFIAFLIDNGRGFLLIGGKHIL